MSVTREQVTEAHTIRHNEHAHPGPRRYIQIAVILAVLTAIEVELSYLPKQINISAAATIPPLIILAVVKFAMVAMFFMHLRFDNRLFTIMFAGGLALALTVFIVVLTIMRVFFA